MSVFDQPSYRHLRDIIAERTSPIVPWVGAGLSIPAGCPSWEQLQEALCNSAMQKADRLPNPMRDERLREVEAIRSLTPWVAFGRLKETLGAQTYTSEIRAQVAPSATGRPPRTYDLLWQLRPAGLLNLNIDRLATQSHNNVLTEQPLVEFSGARVGAFTKVLKSPQSFVANLHGQHEDSSSWVFTQEDLARLLGNPTYRDFISALLLTKTVLFVGIGAQDEAVGGFLESMASQGTSSGPHFWITENASADGWAEKLGIEIVSYSPSDNHRELQLLLEDLTEYVPVERAAKPILPLINIPAETLPPPEEAAALPPRIQRAALNAKAHEVLTSEGGDVAGDYADFVLQYKRAIHNSWFVSLTPPDNELLGYTLLEEIGRGAFGHVYKANGPDGRVVAIKILRQEALQQPDMFDAFRRGVASMRLLTDAKLDGVVHMHQAAELPPFVVMDLVDGPDLRDAVKGGYLSTWTMVLSCGLNIVQVIRAGHQLPERVLHRDIRPTNIMVDNWWRDPDNSKLAVLDFDLSWHRDATGKTIAINPGSNGYLAPEQVTPTRSASTRHANVDSFGIGMTLFFSVAHRDPIPGEHMRADWPNTIVKSARRLSRPQWRSLPKRFARLIECCTRHLQMKRFDVSQIEQELTRLIDANEGDTVEYADLLAEELIARAFVNDEYIWCSRMLRAEVKFISGVTVSCRPLSPDEVGLRIEWLDRGDRSRRNIGKYISTCEEKLRSCLSGRWSNVHCDTSQSELHVTAKISTGVLAPNLDTVSENIAKAIDHLPVRVMPALPVCSLMGPP